MEDNKKKDILDYWPFSYEPRNNQIVALNWLAKQTAKYLILEAPVGCHLLGTELILYSGKTKRVEDIVVGDILMGPDSKPRTVQCLYSGKEMMYTITPTKGEQFVVNKNHILSLKTTNANRAGLDEHKVINISVQDYIASSDDFKNNIKLYRTDCITFADNSTTLPIDSYFLGVLLGDGSICNGQVSVTTADQEILNEVHNQATKFNLQINTQNKTTNAPSYYLTTGKVGGSPITRTKNRLLETLKEICIYDTRSGDKFIPNQYKLSSVQNRLSLLAGLLDTDGYYDGIFTHTTKSIKLHEDVKFVARSLGFAANTYIKTTNGHKYYEAHISGDLDRIPTKIPRKQATARKQKKSVTVTPFVVTEYGVDNFYGFELTDDHLYLMSDFTVTHNSGKSNIGITYSRYIGQRTQNGDSFILTPQRILQKQYDDSFSDNRKINILPLYGKSNYLCDNKNTSCQVGTAIRPRCENCPYGAAKEKAKTASNTVLNYTLALTAFEFTDTFEPRKLVVLDECHTLESHLVSFDAVKIQEWFSKKYDLVFKKQTTLSGALQWIKDYYKDDIEEKYNELQSDADILMEKSPSELTSRDIKLIQEAEEFGQHTAEINMLLCNTEEYIASNFVLVNDLMSFQFKRLQGKYTFDHNLKPMGDRFLFMSSTVLDKDGFCRDLGIPIEDTAFLSIDSDFDVDNRPVYYMPQMKMNYKWSQPDNITGRKQMSQTIESLCGIHEGESGIIHTANYAIASWVVKELTGKVSQQIFHHNPESELDRNEVIDSFMGHNGGILISPSSTEGLDLKYDQGKFAIFVKVPYGYLGDQWIKKRMDMSNEWYRRQAMINIIQGGGRIVRAEDDSGSVYILDGSFAYLLQQSASIVPKWWMDAYQVV